MIDPLSTIRLPRLRNCWRQGMTKRQTLRRKSISSRSAGGVKAIRIVDLHEREIRLFQREELIDHKGQALILPETRSLSAFELREVFTGIELRVLGLIGYLPLTTSLTLNLRPEVSDWKSLAHASLCR